jgi:hypothetical protein
MKKKLNKDETNALFEELCSWIMAIILLWAASTMFLVFLKSI